MVNRLPIAGGLTEQDIPILNAPDVAPLASLLVLQRWTYVPWFYPSKVYIEISQKRFPVSQTQISLDPLIYLRDIPVEERHPVGFLMTQGSKYSFPMLHINPQQKHI
jgi:hypothetical protein